MNTLNEHYQKLFEIMAPWEVRHVAEYVESREVRVAVRLRDGAEVECPRCGKPSSPLPDSGERRKMETRLWRYKLTVDCPVPRCCCATHGEFPIPTPLDGVVEVFEKNSDESTAHESIGDDSGFPRAPGTRSAAQRSNAFIFLGERHFYSNATEAVVAILGLLQKRDPSFLENLERQLRDRRGKRQMIARTKADLYPGRPDLEKDSRTLPDGWLFGSNVSNARKEILLRVAAGVAGLQYGRDIVVNLETRHRG
ncbi:MAG: hypothetical protein LBG65_00965 [Puniceicoccales bacterium]|nr:hypothetical protein [Puniceicoccales bacterium]